eukprot:5045412-Ditylum_brightwellii.AAC.1
MFSNQSLVTVKRYLVVDKNHLGGMVREKNTTIVHEGGVTGSAKSTFFVPDNVLVKRKALPREEALMA